MKKLFTLLAVCCLAANIYAQSYVYVQSTGTSAPYVYYDASATTILTGTQNDVLTTWQTLPFSWNFFGQPVTGYFASDNGYITFDNAATNSIATNDVPPTAGAPNNAIYAFWDDMQITTIGTDDEIRTWTYGDVGNRVHVIQWWSLTDETNNTSSNFVYFAIRIHECGDFDIVHNWKGSGFSTAQATIGCEDATGTTGVAVTGSPNIDFPSISSVETDDIVYHFYYNSQPNYDLTVSAIDNENVVTGSDNLTGEVTNWGAQTITSFDINYSVDGNPAVSSTISPVNISPSGGTGNYSAAINLSTPGTMHTIKVWASNLNGANSDELPCNDTLITASVFENLGVTSPKYVLLEEFTTAPCQFCPDGEIKTLEVLNTYPNAIGASIHAGFLTDAMTIPEHSSYASAFAPGAPTATIDRRLFPGETSVAISRSDWLTRTAECLNRWAACGVSITKTYNDITNVLDATVTVDFVDYAIPGDMRITLFVVEDSVVGFGSGYDQANYYDTQVGHPYYGAGNPIIGYVHDRVVRDVLSPTWGTSGVISSNPQPSDVFSQNYNTTLDAAWNDRQISIIAFVSYYDNDITKRSIINSGEVELLTGIENNKPDVISSSVFPNPVKGLGTLSFYLEDTKDVTVEMYNIFGQKVKTIRKGRLAAGKHHAAFNTVELAEGVYFITVTAGMDTSVHKVVVAN